MTSPKSVQLSVVITVIISITLGIGGIAAAAVAAHETSVVTTALRQEERVRLLEQKSATQEEQFNSIKATLADIKSLLSDHMRVKE